MDPEDLKFTANHEWVSVDGDEATLGITDFAQSELNDVIFVELPEVGTSVVKGDILAVLESVKAAEEVNSPVSGEVVAVNGDLDDEPELINRDPFGGGWIVRVRLSDAAEIEAMLTHDDYEKVMEEAR